MSGTVAQMGIWGTCARFDSEGNLTLWAIQPWSGGNWTFVKAWLACFLVYVLTSSSGVPSLIFLATACFHFMVTLAPPFNMDAFAARVEGGIFAVSFGENWVRRDPIPMSAHFENHNYPKRGENTIYQQILSLPQVTF
jgi:hypothetical protein